MEILCHFLKNVFLTVLFRYNLHAIKLTHLGGRFKREGIYVYLWLHGGRRAKRSYSTFKVRRRSSEEIPLIQGKEQRLHFSRAAMMRYPTSKVRETQVRW